MGEKSARIEGEKRRESFTSFKGPSWGIEDDSGEKSERRKKKRKEEVLWNEIFGRGKPEKRKSKERDKKKKVEDEKPDVTENFLTFLFSFSLLFNKGGNSNGDLALPSSIDRESKTQVEDGPLNEILGNKRFGFFFHLLPFLLLSPSLPFPHPVQI